MEDKKVLLSVKDLEVKFRVRGRILTAIRGISLDIYENESIAGGLLEYPQYTRPRSFEGLEVPEVLTNGNHAQIEAWKHKQALEPTIRKRPDIYEKYIKSNGNE